MERFVVAVAAACVRSMPPTSAYCREDISRGRGDHGTRQGQEETGGQARGTGEARDPRGDGRRSTRHSRVRQQHLPHRRGRAGEGGQRVPRVAVEHPDGRRAAAARAGPRHQGVLATRPHRRHAAQQQAAQAEALLSRLLQFGQRV